MSGHPSPAVQDVSEIAANHMDAILALFKPGAKITVLVRRPEKPDGTQDLVLTNDGIEKAIAALQQRLTTPTLTGEV